MSDFEDFNLHDSLHDGLDSMGFKNATPVQKEAIPVILENKDLIACAQTGTGKTAAYLLPVLHRIASGEHAEEGFINTLILAPTRELAQQIDQQLEGFAYYTGVSSIAVFGGGDGSLFEREKKALSHGADIIIATPGRLLSHLAMGYVKFSKLRHLILDEADRMLDMGFYEDLMRIFSHLPKERQTLMFSATMPPKIRKMAQEVMKDPREISIAISKPAEGIRQLAYSVHDGQKTDLFRHIVTQNKVNSMIIFSSTRSEAKVLEKELKKVGYNAAAIHSDLEQHEREHVLRQFRAGNLKILVATDILSRGIDIEGIELVINYDVPADAEDYVHRIGRTARAASTGTAITFINENDQFKFSKIEKLIGKEVEKVPLPEGFEPGPVYNPSIKRGGGKKFFKKKKSFGRRN